MPHITRDASTHILVGSREFNLAVNPPWAEQGRVKNVNPVCCHDNFDVLCGLEAIQLIQQFQHSPLDFAVPCGGWVWQWVWSESGRGLPPEPPPSREEPIESISSMNMMDGACSRAITNSSLTCDITITSPQYHRPRPSPFESPLQCTSAPARSRRLE